MVISYGAAVHLVDNSLVLGPTAIALSWHLIVYPFTLKSYEYFLSHGLFVQLSGVQCSRHLFRHDVVPDVSYFASRFMS